MKHRLAQQFCIQRVHQRLPLHAALADGVSYGCAERSFDESPTSACEIALATSG